MGSYYRERHSTANTTSQDVAGLTGNDTAEASSDKTLAELRAEAEALGLPTYGTKADLAERIAGADTE